MKGSSCALIAGAKSFDVADMMTQEPEIPRYVIPGLGIEPGPPALLAAYGASGKTYLSIYFALCVASGTDIFERFRVKRGKVLWIDAELGPRKLRDVYIRRVVQGNGLSVTRGDFMALSVVGSPTPMLDTEQGLSALEQACDGYSLCVIDSLRRVHSGDENASSSAVVLQRLTDISEKTGCCFLVIHHAGKGSANGKFSPRGTSAFFDAADTVFDLTVRGDHFILAQTKTRAPERMDPVMYRIENAGEYRANGLGYEGVRFSSVSKCAGSDDIAALILAELAKGEQKRDSLVSATGKRAELVRREIDRLVASGQIVERKEGRAKLYSVKQ